MANEYDIQRINENIAMLIEHNPDKESVLKEKAKPIIALIDQNDLSLGSEIYGQYHGLVEFSRSLPRTPDAAPQRNY